MAYVRTDLRLLKVQGPDARSFLNGLITQRTDLPAGVGTYAAILTPQGKLLADFPLLFVEDELLVMALPASEFDGIFKKLSMFKLKSQVSLSEDTNAKLVSALDAALPYGDPRHEGLCHDIQINPKGETVEAFHAARAKLGIPEGLHDLEVGKSTLIDEGLPVAIDWDKGCYMGQEVTARMRYRALIKRVLVPYTGAAEAGQVLRSGERKIGEVRSSYGACGFAYVMKDFAGAEVEGLSLGASIGLTALGL